LFPSSGPSFTDSRGPSTAIQGANLDGANRMGLPSSLNHSKTSSRSNSSVPSPGLTIEAQSSAVSSTTLLATVGSTSIAENCLSSQPTENDFIFGRGNDIAERSANIAFMQYCRGRLEEYIGLGTGKSGSNIKISMFIDEILLQFKTMRFFRHQNGETYVLLTKVKPEVNRIFATLKIAKSNMLKKQRDPPQQAPSNVVQPEEHDYVFGIGKGIRKRKANIEFRQYCETRIDEWKNAAGRRVAFYKDVVKKFTGRFLSHTNGYWEVLSEDTVLESKLSTLFHNLQDNRNHAPTLEKRKVAAAERMLEEPSRAIDTSLLVTPCTQLPTLRTEPQDRFDYMSLNEDQFTAEMEKIQVMYGGAICETSFAEYIKSPEAKSQALLTFTLDGVSKTSTFQLWKSGATNRIGTDDPTNRQVWARESLSISDLEEILSSVGYCIRCNDDFLENSPIDVVFIAHHAVPKAKKGIAIQLTQFTSDMPSGYMFNAMSKSTGYIRKWLKRGVTVVITINWMKTIDERILCGMYVIPPTKANLEYFERAKDFRSAKLNPIYGTDEMTKLFEPFLFLWHHPRQDSSFDSIGSRESICETIRSIFIQLHSIEELHYSEEQVVDLASEYLQREYFYLKLIQSNFEPWVSYSRLIHQQGDFSLKNPVNDYSWVIEMKGRDVSNRKTCFRLRKYSCPPYDIRKVDILGLAKCDGNVVLEICFYPMRTVDGKENLRNRMMTQLYSAKKALIDASCVKISCRGDKIYIDGKETTWRNVSSLIETLALRVKPQTPFVLSDDEKLQIENEKIQRRETTRKTRKLLYNDTMRVNEEEEELSVNEEEEELSVDEEEQELSVNDEEDKL
jgi:hypothetical protein